MRYSEKNKISLMIIDVLVLFVSVFITFGLLDVSLSRMIVLSVVGIFIAVSSVTNFYSAFGRHGYLLHSIQIMKNQLSFLFVLVFIFFMVKEPFINNRKFLLILILINFILLTIVHSIYLLYKRNNNNNNNNNNKVVVLTTVSRLEKTIRRLGNSASWGGSIIGIVLLDNAKQDINVVNGYTLIPKQDIGNFIAHNVVDEVFINAPGESLSLSKYVSLFESVGIDTSVNINAFDFDVSSDRRIQKLSSYNVIVFSTKFYKISHVILKRLLDIVGATIGIILTGIVALCLFPFITKDGGPLFFSQDRVGRNGRVFKFYKFRSMSVDAESMKQELMAHNTMSGLMFKLDDDPRITSVGKFIRKTSLDELPQFYNVLNGDMSLVGTRPPTLDEYEQYTPEQKKRLSFKPGITGLWQVSGRSDITDFDEIVKMDVAYIDNWTIWSDIIILIKTIKVVFENRGAK